MGRQGAAKAAETGVQLVELSPEARGADRYDTSVANDAVPVGMTGRDVANARPADPQVSNALVAAVGGAIDIRRRGLSYVVEVTAQSESPDQAAEMANGLSNIYLRSLTEARYDASEKANVWLGPIGRAEAGGRTQASCCAGISRAGRFADCSGRKPR